MIRPGVGRRGAVARGLRRLRGAGYPTQRSEARRRGARSGFFHGLGHGVGLEVHEAPDASASGHELVAGRRDHARAGLYRPGFGGVRLEDIVLVTDDGCETITDFPYDLDRARWCDRR